MAGQVALNPAVVLVLGYASETSRLSLACGAAHEKRCQRGAALRLEFQGAEARRGCGPMDPLEPRKILNVSFLAQGNKPDLRHTQAFLLFFETFRAKNMAAVC